MIRNGDESIQSYKKSYLHNSNIQTFSLSNKYFTITNLFLRGKKIVSLVYHNAFCEYFIFYLARKVYFTSMQNKSTCLNAYVRLFACVVPIRVYLNCLVIEQKNRGKQKLVWLSLLIFLSSNSSFASQCPFLCSSLCFSQLDDLRTYKKTLNSESWMFLKEF